MSTWMEMAESVQSEPGPIIREFGCGRQAVEFAKHQREWFGYAVTVTPGINELFAVRHLVPLSQRAPLRLV